MIMLSRTDEANELISQYKNATANDIYDLYKNVGQLVFPRWQNAIEKVPKEYRDKIKVWKVPRQHKFIIGYETDLEYFFIDDNGFRVNIIK